MTDRDKVVKEFADYVHYFTPYCIGDIEDHEMLKDVLELLKEKEKTHWISVKDRLPDRKWVDYLVATELSDGTPGMNVAWLYDDDGGWATTDGSIRNGREVITHWMPVPERPMKGR